MAIRFIKERRAPKGAFVFTGRNKVLPQDSIQDICSLCKEKKIIRPGSLEIQACHKELDYLAGLFAGDKAVSYTHLTLPTKA